MLKRRLALLLALAGAAAASAASCTDGAADDQATLDGGGDDGLLVAARCPDAAPSPGTACALPEGTTCAFGACGAPLASCSAGSWRYATNEPEKPPCPTETPEDDTACPACWPDGATCTYGSLDCTAEDASANRAQASCVSDRWVVAFEPCRDAGTDVQGDAGEDAD